MQRSLVGSEMCIRDRHYTLQIDGRENTFELIFGAPEEIRTPGRLITNQMLYQSELLRQHPPLTTFDS